MAGGNVRGGAQPVSRSFAVERVERRPKGGAGFDRITGNYRDNLIVYATMIT